MDKRTQPRIRRRVMVRYGTDEPGKTAFTRNLSVGGAQLQTNSPVQPGTRLVIELKFPDRTFRMTARVAWALRMPAQLAYVKPGGMGIEFLERDPDWPEFFERWRAG